MEGYTMKGALGLQTAILLAARQEPQNDRTPKP